MSRRSSRRSAGFRNRALFIARRFWLIPVAATLALWAAVWWWTGGGDEVERRLLAYSARRGFVVSSVLIEGRVNTDPASLRDALAVGEGDPILGLSLHDIRKRVESLAWVRAARVERRLPDILFVRLEERRPAALWQREGQAVLVDAQGTVLATEGLDRFADLPMVAGSTARFHVRELVEMLAGEPAIASRLDLAQWVGDRRWSLRLRNGMAILLPAADPEAALRRIGRAQEEDKVLDSPIVAEIDTRLAGKMVLRPRPSAPREDDVPALEPAAGGQTAPKNPAPP